MWFLNTCCIIHLFSYPQCIVPDSWRTIEVLLYWVIVVQEWPQPGSLTSLVRPAQVAIKVILFGCLLVREADRWWRHKWFFRGRRLKFLTHCSWMNRSKNHQVWKKVQCNSTYPDAGYPDRLGSSGKSVENSTKVLWLEITGYRIQTV